MEEQLVRSEEDDHRRQTWPVRRSHPTQIQLENKRQNLDPKKCMKWGSTIKRYKRRRRRRRREKTKGQKDTGGDRAREARTRTLAMAEGGSRWSWRAEDAGPWQRRFTQEPPVQARTTHPGRGRRWAEPRPPTQKHRLCQQDISALSYCSPGHTCGGVRAWVQTTLGRSDRAISDRL